MYVALLTPLHDNRTLNASVAQKLLLHLLAKGLDGAYVAGTTGEGMLLPFAVRRALVEAATEVLPAGKRLLVHVGTPQVGDALALAEHAARCGAHAISSLPPAGGTADVMSYYRELAANSPLPLILYYFPKVAPSAFSCPDDLFQVCELPNVVGIKFTDTNLYLLNRLSKRGVLVFNGYDEMLAAGLLMGAKGGIGTTYNLMAEGYLQIYAAALRGDWQMAHRVQSQVNDVIEVLFRYPFFPAVREAIKHIGFDCGPLMSGETMANESDRDRFLAELMAYIPRNPSPSINSAR